MAPASDRMAVKRLANLPATGSDDRPLGAVEVEAGGLPVKAKKIDNSSAFAFETSDYRLQVHDQDRQR